MFEGKICSFVGGLVVVIDEKAGKIPREKGCVGRIMKTF
jgi:hypothetical protein